MVLENRMWRRIPVYNGTKEKFGSELRFKVLGTTPGSRHAPVDTTAMFVLDITGFSFSSWALWR